MNHTPCKDDQGRNTPPPCRKEPLLRAAKQAGLPTPRRVVPAATERKRTGPRWAEPLGDSGDDEPALVLSPLCWLKLMLFLHGGDTEVGGFGISAERDSLYLEDFVTVKQRTTAVSVAFDDAAVADHFDDCVDASLSPTRFARVWIHTHPGDSPDPSTTDEQTFARVFGACDWAIMLIVSRTGRTYCRLSFSAGPGGAVLLPVRVDWAAWPQLLLERADALEGLFEGWMDDYGEHVIPEGASLPPAATPREDRFPWSGDWWREDDVYGPLNFDDGWAFARGGDDALAERFAHRFAGEVGVPR